MIRWWVIGLILVGCGPAAKLRRAEKLIRKAEEMGAVWKIDTVHTTATVYVPEVKIDSVFVQKVGDTIVLEKERLKIRVVRLPGDTILVDGECVADTIYKKVPFVVSKTIQARSRIKWWWLVIAGLVGAGVVTLFKLFR